MLAQLGTAHDKPAAWLARMFAPLCRRVLSLLKLQLSRTTQPGLAGPVHALGEHWQRGPTLSLSSPSYGTPYLPNMCRSRVQSTLSISLGCIIDR